ncbi:MarR family winged helix-turn-helix transcriptional regulator [Streptomyces sp. NPDC058476]|uniref:MarR family winged helix-turn-helix transcriptional regulator n=1 Tax=Streptomyces sp. NPDC058476 TaxID=3346519 RepID=UPI003646A64F
MDHLIATRLLSQQEMARRLGLNVTDFLCFTCVLKAGENLLTAGDLAEHAHVTTGAATGIVNRLERAGFVTRRPDPTDRRRVRIAAQPAAVARVLALHEPYQTRLTALLSDYTSAETAVLHDWFTRTGTLTSDYLDELRAGGEIHLP